MVQFFVMGIGAVVNALVFSGANTLFAMKTEAERKKESDAKEKFQEDLAVWNQRIAERAKCLATRQKEISVALASDKETLSTLSLYQKYCSPNKRPLDQSADTEPTLTNYYK